MDLAGADNEDLAVQSVKMNSRGTVTIKFNKNILVPSIEIDSESTEEPPEEEEAELSTNKTVPPKIAIEDFVKLHVDYDDFYEDLNKEISSYAAISVDARTLVFQVAFAKPSDITTDNTLPDYLFIELLLP